MARIVVTGGAGFLGSHLCDALIARGDEVVCVDNVATGRWSNVAHLEGNRSFTAIEHDVTEPLPEMGQIDGVMHFASAASPPEYLRLPIETLNVGSRGTENALQVAERHRARFLMASTSEVYGDPHAHPQSESYWGNVNPIGPRSVYDEAKRYAEAVTMAYRRTRGVNTAIVRIFNTYGPRMKGADGRVVSNFISQALADQPLTVYGDGSQTRSFCYVEDEIRGFLALFDSELAGPVNLGNPNEFTVLELALLVREVVGADVPIIHQPLPVDDPTQRCPDISLARTHLGWEPAIHLREGVTKMSDHLREEPMSPVLGLATSGMIGT